VSGFQVFGKSSDRIESYRRASIPSTRLKKLYAQFGSGLDVKELVETGYFENLHHVGLATP